MVSKERPKKQVSRRLTPHALAYVLDTAFFKGHSFIRQCVSLRFVSFPGWLFLDFTIVQCFLDNNSIFTTCEVLGECGLTPLLRRDTCPAVGQIKMVSILIMHTLPYFYRSN